MNDMKLQVHPLDVLVNPTVYLNSNPNMRPRTCRRYMKYGLFFFFGYFLLRGALWIIQDWSWVKQQSIYKADDAVKKQYISTRVPKQEKHVRISLVPQNNMVPQQQPVREDGFKKNMENGDIPDQMKAPVKANVMNVHDAEIDELGDSNFKYSINANGQEIHGRHFALKAQKLTETVEDKVEEHFPIQLPDDHFPTIVTAVSRSTFRDVEKLIESIQYFLPNKKMVIFHLDLTVDQLAELKNTCDIDVRILWIWMFPKHLQNPEQPIWKPLVIQMALAEFGSIMWIDPKVRLVSGNFQEAIKASQSNDLIVIGSHKKFSTFAVTHPDMYSYFPTDLEKLKVTQHLEMKIMIVHNTNKVQEKLFKWLTLCSIEKACIAPAGAKTVCEYSLRGDQYANCHMFDESALNILLKNWFSFNMLEFTKLDTFTMATEDWGGQPVLKMCA